MVDTSVAMQNRDTFFFCTFTVASVHTVVRAVVPLAWEHVETLCQLVRGDEEWGKKKKDMLIKLKHFSVKKLGTMTRKISVTSFANIQRAARHRCFLSHRDDYADSTVRPEQEARATQRLGANINQGSLS